jgi:hypothetical protein
MSERLRSSWIAPRGISTPLNASSASVPTIAEADFVVGQSLDVLHRDEQRRRADAQQPAVLNAQ